MYQKENLFLLYFTINLSFTTFSDIKSETISIVRNLYLLSIMNQSSALFIISKKESCAAVKKRSSCLKILVLRVKLIKKNN